MIETSLKLAGLGVLMGCTSSPQQPECSDVSGTSCTWAGVQDHSGNNGDGLDRTEAWLSEPADLTFGSDGKAWIVDWNNHLVRRVEDDRTLKTVIGTGYEGDGPGTGPTDPTYKSDRLPVGNPVGALGTTVALNHPTNIQFAPDGTVVLAAWHDNKIRVMDPVTNIVKVLAGDGYGYAGDGGPAYTAVFNVPKAVAINPAGDIYVLDQRNELIRKIANDATRTITKVGGQWGPITGAAGYEGDGGDASLAKFGWQQGSTPIPGGALALNGTDLYISDGLNNRIRKLDLVTNQITCIAGDGMTGSIGDGGQALAAEFNNPLDLEIGPDGRLYVADTGNNVIRAIDLTTGIVERVAGTGEPCSRECFEAEGAKALDVKLATPYGITFDPAGNLYIADTENSRIVRIAK